MTPTSDRTGAAPTPTGPVSKIDYSERIPNNVNLAEDRRLQRALEGWQPKFLDWWRTLGPALPTKDVYLRTAIAVGRDGSRQTVAGWRVPAHGTRPLGVTGATALHPAQIARFEVRTAAGRRLLALVPR